MPEFQFTTTHVGSLPHKEISEELTTYIATTLALPAWPQLPRRSFRESMYVQYSPLLPAIVEDTAKEKIYFDSRGDLSSALEGFYTLILDDDVDAFALRPEYAAGFYAMLDSLHQHPGEWAKGQVTGPISFGLTVTDQDLRASLYNDMLADAIVKNAAMNARWQVRQLKSLRPNAVIFVDEPYLASFGSAFISLGREQAIAYLNEVFEAIHSEGGIAGVHCCANTDWSLLLATQVDILNLDAYGYLENLALYPTELRAFLDRGGAICWGIVPNNEQISETTPQELADRLREGIQHLCEKAAGRGVSIAAEEFATRSLISPACGLGSTSTQIAGRVLENVRLTGEILQQG